MDDTTETIDEEQEDEMRMPRNRPPTADDSPEAFAVTRADVSRISGLHADRDRLAPDERRELVELTRALTDHADGRSRNGGWNFARLSRRKQRRWQRLVEQASGADGYFSVQAELHAAARRAQDVALQQVRPPKRPHRLVDAGDVFISKALFLMTGAHARTNRNPLKVGDWGWLVLLLLLFENSGTEPAATALAHGARFVDPETLEIDSTYGIVQPSYDPAGKVDWKKALARLELLTLFDVERLGGTWRIRRGHIARLMCERTGSA